MGGKRGPTNDAGQKLPEKIKRLPPADKAAEVEDFVAQRKSDCGHPRAVTRISEDAFQKVWGNQDDANYDQL